jgi:hypothetical protein
MEFKHFLHPTILSFRTDRVVQVVECLLSKNNSEFFRQSIDYLCKVTYEVSGGRGTVIFFFFFCGTKV